MDCNNPTGCRTPLDCSGDGTCAAGGEYNCESMLTENAQSMVAQSFTFGEPIELYLQRLEAQIAELRTRLDSM